MTIISKKSPLLYMCGIYVLIGLILPLTTVAQTVNIPDDNLRAAIENALNKTPGDTITAEDMETLTHFVAHNVGIRGLTGLEFATNLQVIRCNNNSISDLSPLAELTSLHFIEFGHNEISDLSPLKDLINLTELHVYHNLIQDLSPLEGLIHLGSLNISNNAIVDLSPLAGLIKLRGISMSGNPPADLSPLKGLTNLTGFFSWGTPILNLSALSELPKIRKIDICGGEISDLSSLANATTLNELYLVGNQISDLSPLKDLTNLKKMNLEGNEITDVSPISELTGLTWLKLRNNKISDIAALAKLTNLTWLHLSHNSISDITALSELANLVWLHLGNNIISDLSPLAGLSKLTWVGLINNGVSNVLGLENLPDHIFVSQSGSVEGIEKGPKIEGPWLWVIVPGTQLGNVDFLANASGGKATEIKVSTYGATEGKAVGESEWTLHQLSATGGNNINEMTEDLGWGSGSEIYDHVVYGAVTLDSPREQNTTMLVGSGDAVKVWLNGELVHYNSVVRGAENYQDSFSVTLKEGPNALLVAIDNRGHGNFSGFFGFEAKTEYTVIPPGTGAGPEAPAWDVNKDGLVDILDLIIVGQNFGETNPSDPRADVNGDGKINISDLVLIAQHFGENIGATAPAIIAVDSRISPEMIQSWISLAQANNDGSPAFLQGIANLQRLLDTLLVPKRSVLLANYPNPFNPETWIPYQLATGTDVQIHIYAATGTLVQTLNMGYQPAGIYQQRNRAAYWDGKNTNGESVASGVYFYMLTAGQYTATRKMLIQK